MRDSFICCRNTDHGNPYESCNCNFFCKGEGVGEAVSANYVHKVHHCHKSEQDNEDPFLDQRPNFLDCFHTLHLISKFVRFFLINQSFYLFE